MLIIPVVIELGVNVSSMINGNVRIIIPLISPNSILDAIYKRLSSWYTITKLMNTIAILMNQYNVCICWVELISGSILSIACLIGNRVK